MFFGDKRSWHAKKTSDCKQVHSISVTLCCTTMCANVCAINPRVGTVIHVQLMIRWMMTPCGGTQNQHRVQVSARLNPRHLTYTVRSGSTFIHRLHRTPPSTVQHNMHRCREGVQAGCTSFHGCCKGGYNQGVQNPGRTPA